MMRSLLLPGIQATPETKDIDSFLNKIYKIHNACFMVYVPVIIAVIAFSCFWGYKQSMLSHYTDVTEDWEACLAQTYYTVPITAYLDKSAAAGAECVKDQFLIVENTQCDVNTDIPCITQVQENCLSSPAISSDVKIPVGQLISALSYVGIQTAIFSLASHGMQSFRHCFVCYR